MDKKFNEYGYYTLPILFGDRFVGRIEAIPDRKTGILEVKGLWWEPDVRITKRLTANLDKTLKNFAKFNDCRYEGIHPEEEMS